MFDLTGKTALVTGAASADHYQERLGWTLGAGAEMAIAPNLSAKLEYLYYDLGRTSFAATGNAAVLATPALTGVFYTGETRTAGSLVRAGLNVKF